MEAIYKLKASEINSNLMESIAEDPAIRFTNDEFKKMVSKL